MSEHRHRHSDRQSEASEASKNITLMVIWSSTLFMLGNLPFTIEYSLRLILTHDFNYNYLFNITFDILYLIHSLNIFIYLKFNKLYRNIFVSYFRAIYLFGCKLLDKNSDYHQTVAI